MIGQTVGHYRITAKIGSGGMGEVYRATDTTLHREVAIKVISPEFANDPERMARLEREAQVLASLTHGSIAAVYGLEKTNGQRALVMELVDAEDLSARLLRDRMAMNDALRTGAFIAEALEAAHEHGVIHRDLKPANIKLLDSGGVKLLDFGLAKALEDSRQAHRASDDSATASVAATRAGMILGTAAYMSPEQATSGRADKRSDVWSFGVVLFELLTGTRLFDGQTTSHVLADVIRAEIDFGRLPAGVPADVRALIERCLERDPRRRLRDIREARLVLERSVERGSGAHSGVRSTAVVTRSPARWRERLRWIAGGAVAAGLVVGTTAWLLTLAAEPKQPLHFELAVPGGALFERVGNAFELSPDGQAILMVVEGETEETSALVLRRLTDLRSSTLVTAAGMALLPYNPFFSPDGAWVGYAVADELRRVPATGGTPTTIAKVSRSRGATWGPDGTIVFTPTHLSGLSRVHMSGGEPQPVTTLDAAKKEVTHRWPQMLPGGKAVLFTVHTSASDSFDGASLEVVELDTGERTVVHQGGTYGRYLPTGHLVYLSNNTLFAVKFDLDALRTDGQPVPILHDVRDASGEGAAHFSYGANGLMAYLHGTPKIPEYPITWVDRDGRSTPIPLGPGTYANPRLSPQGTRLALTVYREGNWDIWVYDIERQVFTRVTHDEQVESEQIWSPDGRELAYGLDGKNSTGIILRKPADGFGSATVVATIPGYAWPTSWSPDGRLLVVMSGNSDIGTIPLTGTEAKPTWIVNSAFAEENGTISPDGRFLAYTSHESGRREIYVRQFPSGSGRWRISTESGNYPRWTKGGRELVYRTSTGIAAVEIEVTDGAFRSGAPRELFEGSFAGGVEGVVLGQFTFPDYDVSPDGSRFVMFPQPVDSGDNASHLVTVTTNWFDEVRRLLTSR